MTKRFQDLLEAELAERIKALPTEELISIMGVKMRRSSRPPARVERVRHDSGVREAITVWAAIGDVLAEWNRQGRYPNSTELVRAVQARRPGTPEPTIRAEISRRRKAGDMKADPADRFRAAG